METCTTWPEVVQTAIPAILITVIFFAYLWSTRRH